MMSITTTNITMMKNTPMPSRRCVGCREMKEKSILIRVVANSGGLLVVDYGGKSPGRGAYLCRSGECVAKAQKSKGLARSMKRAETPEIYAQLKAEAER